MSDNYFRDIENLALNNQEILDSLNIAIPQNIRR